MATRKIEFKIPEKIELTKSFWGTLGSVLLIGALLAFMFVPALQTAVGNPGFTAGAIVMLAVLVLISDRISFAVVRQHNIGWVILAAGLYMIFWQSVGPLAKAIWASLAPAHITFLVIGIILVLVALRILRKRS